MGYMSDRTRYHMANFIAYYRFLAHSNLYLEAAPSRSSLLRIQRRSISRNWLLRLRKL